MTIQVLFADSEGIIGWAIRSQQSQTETNDDIAELAEEFKNGNREALDDDDQIIDHVTITDEEAWQFATAEILHGDWGRDGWAITWVNIENGTVTYQGGDRDQAMFLFATQAEAVALAEILLAKDPESHLEVWAMTG